MIVAANGGALVDKTPAQTRALIENIASILQQFSSRSETFFKKVNEVSEVSHMEQRMGNMERMMQQISAVIILSHEGNMKHANSMYQNQQRLRLQQEHQGTSVDDKFTLMMQSVQEISKTMQGFNQFQQKSEMAMRDVQYQVSQLASDMNQLKAQGSGKLPSQTLNHKENVNAIELRSGKKVEKPVTSPESHGHVLEQQEDKTTPNKADLVTNSHSKPLVSTNVTSPPFPSRFAKSKKETLYKEIYEIFKNIQVNIPLLEAIRQVPRYASFLKELCTNKHKLVGNEVMYVGENASTYLQKKLPPKLKDPGSFTIPCTISTTRFDRALLDLGATINVMPASIYETLDLGPLKDIGIIIQLADRYTTYLKGVVEDVLVQVSELIFPADFYVLDMKDEDSPSSTTLLLSRPFMRTSRTKIGVFKGTITMEFNGEPISFNIFEAMRYPSDVHSCFSVDVIDSLSQQVFELDGDDTLDKAIMKSLDCGNGNHNDMKK
ncbi:uncharacterized protein LOC113334546 [Papaver somniferum]|uniref:uncharacterized protein LOC113334546 n=1 Tax=Papaver somniferum TaxID=3469 RepID=UPI000E6FEEA6|nr:uncharacterized protein LOC113334546 [Papaver somniferum]